MPYLAKSMIHLKPTQELVLVKLLFNMGLATITVGVPLYFLSLGFTDSEVGFYVGAITLIIAVLSLFLPPFFEKYNELKILIASTLLTGFAFIALGFAGAAIVGVILFFVSHFSSYVSSSSLGILFKDSTRSKKEFQRDTGLLGSIGNFSWFMGPLLGGLALNYAGFKGLFLLAGLLCSLAALYVFLFPFKPVVKKRDKIDSDLKANMSFYVSEKPLRSAYLQRLGVSVWWGFIWTFVPIFMSREGYSEASMGIYIGLTQLPLFLFEFKTVNVLTKLSYKAVFLLSYGLLAAVCVLAFLSSSLPLALGALFIGSISLSFLEPISDLFFFDQVTRLDEERTYPIYSTSSSIGSTLAKLGVGLSLALFADKFAFIVIALMMAYIAYDALSIRPHRQKIQSVKTPEKNTI